MVGKEQSGFSEDLPVLKFLQFCRFPLFLFKHRKVNKYSGSFPSFDEGEEEVGFIFPNSSCDTKSS